jgi:hypothetical protein
LIIKEANWNNRIRFLLNVESKKMAKATPEFIQALRSAIAKLEKSDDYQWGHMGSCNCGYLAQE